MLRKYHFREGFTLLEALVCLAITSLVAVLVLDAVRLASTGAVQIERFVRSDMGERIDMVVLRDAVASSRAEHAGSTLAFSGDANAFSGYTTHSVMPGNFGSALYTVALVRGADTVTLIYREQTGEDGLFADWQVRTWAADAARFEYRDDLTGGWVDAWPVTEPKSMRSALPGPGTGSADGQRITFCSYLPSAIRLTVEARGEPVYGLILTPSAGACPRARISDMVRI
jgi:prepilin-type N-terminal cleavage/methylation domain-containing protein